MTKIRVLKKELNQLTGELVCECLTFQHFNPDIKEEKVESIIKEILKKSGNINSKINLLRKEKNNVKPKKYINDIIKEVNEGLMPVMDKLKGLKSNKTTPKK